MGVLAVSSMAQVSSTLSPYSQFGLGVLAEQSQGFNRSMSGLYQGMRGGKIVNMQNPASYSAVDSLTMVFDLGVSGQITNFKEGGTKVNGRTGNFDYAVASFRLFRKFGLSFGVVPFSNVGYKYSSKKTVGTSSDVTTETHDGSGGFSQVYLGAGWEAFKGFSIGANISYFWGKYDKQVSLSSSDAYVNTLTKTYTMSVNSYKLDLGAQYQRALNKNNLLTIGTTVSFGHKLGADAELVTTNTNPLGVESKPDTMTVSNAFSLPFTFGVGASLVHKNSLTVGLDYQLQKWSSLSYPVLNDNTKRYELKDGLLMNRHKVTVGADWIPDPNPMTRSFLKRVHYRAGVSYATPYYKIKEGSDGPTELTLSAGFGIPIFNSWNNRSILNITAQWVHNAASGFVTENAFRLTIGLTFNERWFAKWKVD